MRKGFTMIELIVVMVIIGIMAGFSIPAFMKSVNRTAARNAILNSNVIHSSNVLYRIRNGVNLTAANLAAVNTALGLNIVGNATTYVCNAATCVATGTGFTVTTTLAAALAANNVNPVCAGASCP